MDPLLHTSAGRSSRAFRRRVTAYGVAGLLGLALGCSPLDGGGGCAPPPPATDASAGGVSVRNSAPPCTYSNEGVRGSNGHLLATVYCPGASDPFLVAVKMNGRPTVLREVRGVDYGHQIEVDAGEWDPGDTLWHQVEVVVDPLNLFRETDETNNRWVGQVRMVAPDLSVIDGLSRVIDSQGLTVSSALVGQPLRVVTGARVGGRYQTAELSAKSAAFDFAMTVAIGSCDQLAGGPPLGVWDWTPSAPGDYEVEFRVRILSGEAQRDTTNDVITRTFSVR